MGDEVFEFGFDLSSGLTVRGFVSASGDKIFPAVWKFIRRIALDGKAGGQGTHDSIHFVGGQGAEFSFQFDCRNGLDLLEVKCPGF